MSLRLRPPPAPTPTPTPGSTTLFLPARARPAHRPAAPAHSAPPSPLSHPAREPPGPAQSREELRGAAAVRGRTGGRAAGLGKARGRRARLESSRNEARPRLLLPLERGFPTVPPRRSPSPFQNALAVLCPEKWLVRDPKPGLDAQAASPLRGAAPGAPGQPLVPRLSK